MLSPTKHPKDWTSINEDGYFFPSQESAEDAAFTFDDICDEIELSFRENFEKIFLPVH